MITIYFFIYIRNDLVFHYIFHILQYHKKNRTFTRRKMISTLMKNIKKAEVLKLKDEVSYQEGPVVSKTLAQNSALSVTLFAF